jgi:hypothetical protein
MPNKTGLLPLTPSEPVLDPKKKKNLWVMKVSKTLLDYTL